MNRNPSKPMDLPPNLTLPLFVYGALKPGMPAFGAIRSKVETHTRDSVSGELLVRDGLPLLRANDYGIVEGFLMQWKAGHERNAYTVRARP